LVNNVIFHASSAQIAKTNLVFSHSRATLAPLPVMSLSLISERTEQYKQPNDLSSRIGTKIGRNFDFSAHFLYFYL
jgi:hypothetical protein